MQWQPVDTIPEEGEFILAVWEGGWDNPYKRLKVYHAHGFPTRPAWGGSYRTEEGEAYRLAGWMPIPKLSPPTNDEIAMNKMNGTLKDINKVLKKGKQVAKKLADDKTIGNKAREEMKSLMKAMDFTMKLAKDKFDLNSDKK